MKSLCETFWRRSLLAIACIGALLIAVGDDRLLADDVESVQFFETRIRPVLVRHCYECHSHAAAEVKGGLLLDSRDAVRIGGESGPAVVPFKPEQSLIISALRHESFEMPPGKRLDDGVVADVVKWITDGAADPRDLPPDFQTAADDAWKETLAERLEWWSLKPIAKHQPSLANNGSWANSTVDHFILAGLEAAGLKPSAQAERRTLIRRLYFVLLGLPPDPMRVETFVNDTGPDAYAKLVEQLLASPHFGEHWARHWMDVVRYADTYGYEWDVPAKGAWRYRDYLVRAFNNDVPFDQLVREQIAGDLLPEPRLDHVEGINESRIGPMFFQLGEKRHGDSSEFNGIHQEMLDNKIDALTKAFQATTVACARCHNHKIDAVAQSEYYALGGALMSSRWVSNTVDLPERNAVTLARLQQLKDDLRPYLAAKWLEESRQITSSQLAALSEANIPLEHPFHVWGQLQTVVESNGNLESRWQELKSQYANERTRRVAENLGLFQVVADFRNGIPEGWSVDGTGLQSVTPCGDFTVALTGDAIIGQVLPGGLFTYALSPKLNGALRTPWLQSFSHGLMSFEGTGGDFAAQRTVIDNAFLCEKQTYVSRNEYGWWSAPTYLPMKDRHSYMELATKTSNPNFPPRVGLGAALTEEQISDPGSWFGVTRIVLHDINHPPVDELERFTALFEGVSPTTLDAVAEKYRRWFLSAVESWSQSRSTADDVKLINWMLSKGLLTNTIDACRDPRIDEIVASYREVEAQIRIPWTVNGMADVDSGYNYHLNIRGDYDQLGGEIPRGYVRALTPRDSQFRSANSGRLELSSLIASDDNPLTARVFVNRNWSWLFGTGLVDTPNDFGRLGDTPSHPELLDDLAAQFMAEGWSTKALIRTIVLSRTFQQSGEISEAARSIDPRNRLLHHYPLRRLDAEMIRDSMLQVSGRLDPALFGPPVDPYRAAEDGQKRLFSGPIDGNGRRAIYTKVTIMEPAQLLATFNAPDPKIPTGKRDVTNTPAQSLTLLNDPFVNEQAGHWAAQIIQQAHGELESRIANMFETALGRQPTIHELDRWNSAVIEFAKLRGVENSEIMTDVLVWQDVAHAFFNLKEFLYYQ